MNGSAEASCLFLCLEDVVWRVFWLLRKPRKHWLLWGVHWRMLYLLACG